MTGEGVCGLVVGSFKPLGCEVVRHDACSKALQPRIFNFIESVGVQNRNERVMVCDDRKVTDTRKKDVALSNGPSNS